MARSYSGFSKYLWKSIFFILFIPALLIPIFTSNASAALPWNDWNWPGYPDHDIVYYGVGSRSSLNAKIGLYTPYGFDRNFAWYSNETTLTVQKWDGRAWATWSAISGYGSWWSDGRWWTKLYPLFYPGATIRTYEWNGSFIAKVCGNNSRWGSSPHPPKISGYKWNDLNENGNWDTGEPPISGWEIRLYKDGHLRMKTNTNSSGYYQFTVDANSGLYPGWYVISETPRTGWHQTNGGNKSVLIHEGPYSAGRNYGSNNFGNFKYGSISGRKWIDINGNGITDAGDTPGAGWPINLKKNGVVIKSALTDANGNYKFSNLGYGNYTIEEEVTSGWYMVAPSTGSHSCLITSGSACNGKDFLNAQYGSIQPVKVHDLDMNAEWAFASEPLLAGWMMHLRDGNNNELRPPVTTTDSLLTSPRWSQLRSGTYWVSEDEQPGYLLTGQNPQQVSLLPGHEETVPFFNIGTATLEVIKFHDLDGDGSNSLDDPEIAGWGISLTGQAINGQNIAETASTDDMGNAVFENLIPGCYEVREKDREWWRATTGISETICLSPGEKVTIQFGNILTGDLEGYKYHDLNGNGTLDLGEPPVEGVEITLMTANDDSVGLPVMTDANGRYEFKSLKPGSYKVSESLPEGWLATSGGTTADVTVEPGQMNRASDLLNVKTIPISGYKFDDSNANGIWDDGETTVPGWEMKLEVWKDNAWTETGTAFTGEDGSYTFSGLMPGTYRVTEILVNGWKQTYGPQPVEVTGGSDVTGHNFGNVRLGSIIATKWHDQNNNGAWDEGEQPLSNWSFHISGTTVNGEAVDEWVQTGPAGEPGSLGGLLPGQYRVEEESRDWWLPTTATVQEISLTEGNTATAAFGNREYGNLEGYKYHDRNGNGQLDEGEPPVQGVTVTLTGPNGGNVTMTTDSVGRYEFRELSPGSYIVSEAVSEGWAASGPTSTTVVVAGSRVNTAPDFLNVELIALSGTKYDDSNINGIRDTGEATLPGWEIILETMGDGGWTEIARQLTGTGGSYSFSGIWPGTYRITETMKDSWRQMAAPAESISVLGGDKLTGLDFGNVELGSITLTKWDDSNANGAREAGEQPLSWEFQVTGTAVNGEPFERTVMTGVNGEITVDGLFPGNYSAKERAINRTIDENGFVTEPGWKPTTPTSASFALAEGGNQSASFGNIQMGWIQGRVTHEVWGHPVSGIRIVLEDTGQVTYTNSDGYYFFYDVEPNETGLAPTPYYIVSMDLSDTKWLTHDSVSKPVVVPEGESGIADFTVYDSAYGNQPRTIGYWKNWSNHYTQAEMDALVALVRAGSTEFANLTTDQVAIILKVNKQSTMREKARAQYLGAWLNLASEKLGLDTVVNLTSIINWQSVVNDSDGLTTVWIVMKELEEEFANNSLTMGTWEVIKNILDALNNSFLT